MGKLKHITIGLIVFFAYSLSHAQDVPATERQALIDLYNATDGANWNRSTNWNTTNNVSTWEGVTVVDSTVVGLALRANKLTGTIPTFINQLPNLKDLDLSLNFLSSSIPSELGQLSFLETLNIEGCLLTGTIPSELGNLSGLTLLQLDNNQLSGNIPIGFGNLVNINTISLRNNDLSGQIPSELGNLLYITKLRLEGNQLSGSLPSSLGNLTTLTDFRFFGNQLSGSIPQELGNLTNLVYLYLNSNQFSGSIPSSFENLVNLQGLGLSNNLLSGTIPSGLSSLSNLISLSFGNNKFLFEDFEAQHLSYVASVNSYSYSPQANVDQIETPTITEGDNITLTSTALTSTNNSYQWYKDGVAISGATSKDYVITNATSADAGVYYFEAANSVVTGLTLTRNNITLTVEADSCGVSATEKQALLDLYNSTDGDNWTNTLANNQPWDTNIPVCDWRGVTVVNGNVTQIDLPYNNLSGNLPTSLGNLTNLSNLSLDYNTISGTIPAELGNLTNLETLNLYRNTLSGTIPAELGNLTNLTSLSLGNNTLSGTIPAELGNLTNLTGLSLGNNTLSGTIPPELGNLTNLTILHLFNNTLSGTIPPELGNLTNLTRLSLNNNNLSGGTPNFTTISGLIVLEYRENLFVFSDFESWHAYYVSNVSTSYTYSPQAKVDQEETLSVFDGNSITLSSTDLTSANNSYQWYKDGVAIPGATGKDYVITNATSADAGVYYFEATNSVVTGLTLTRNNITLTVEADTCGVSATEKQALLDLYNSTDGDNWTNTLANNQPWDTNIPVCDWYGVTVVNGQVTSVDLDNNSLTGTIPNSIGDLTNVTYLELAHNQISGTLPSSIGSMSSLTTLFLEVNQISGSIPSSIGNLSNLTQLKIGYNLLSGSIPVEIGNLTYLSRLNLNGNNLSGSLPAEIGNLSNLIYLYLIENEISGAIPPELGNLTKLRYFWLSNNLFTGEIPVELGNLTSAIDFHLDGNLLSGAIPTQLGNLINLDRIRLNGNQLTGPIPSEFGNFSVIRSIYLNNNQLSGNIPIEIAQIPTLQTISINENQLAGDIPSQFSTLSTLTTFNFYDNNFIFSNFETEHPTYGANLTSYNYSPQAKVDQEETLSILEYSSITLTSEVLTSTNNSYQWYKDGVAISGATSKDYVITNATTADAGVYYFEATNSVVTGLTLTRNNITLSVESGSNTVVQQNFCTADGVPTVADLLIPTPTGVSPIWYTTETGGTPLDPSTVLQDRNTYWRDYSGNTDGRAAVKAIIDALLPIGNSLQSFDSTTNPTLGDIVVALNPLSSASQIQWYATATSTDVLSSATLLVDGLSYYAAESVTACRLKIKVNVAPQEICVEVVSEGTGGQSVVDGSFEGAANVLIPNNRNEAMGASGWGAVLGTPDTFGTPYSNPNDPYLQATFTASPNGGICAGALRYQDQAETFAANIDGLETSATYIVEFYTANITNVVNEAVSKEVLGHWEVTLGGTTKLSGAITPNTTGATTWKRQRLEFTNIGGSLQLLQFKVGSSATDQNSAYPVYMLIDGIRVYVKPQNVYTTVCSTVDTQVFCDSDDDNPLTIADLASPTGESVTWYSSALGGRQYFSTYELSNISSDFIWADDGSGGPRIPVEILLDFGAPTGDNYQSFDIADNPTLADLVVEGTNITWHSSYTSTTVLPLSTPLVSNTVYYAAQDGYDCRSSVEVFVGVPMLTGQGNQVFCSSSEPTISDLVMETTSPSYTLVWYNAETDGVAYNSTDSLVDGQIYYATQTNGTGESEERYPVKVSVVDTAEENILYERDIEVASGTTLADLTTFFELDPGILWYDFPQSGTAYSSSYTVNDGETYYARISEGICDALEVLAVTVYIEDVVNPELVTCIKFIPQPGDRYVISGWVREHSATAVPSSTLEFTEQQTFIALLDHLTSKILNKEQVPPVYELQSDPQAPKVNALLPFIKNFTGTNVTVYNFQLETEQIGAQQVAVGYSFALAPDNLYRFVYRTPLVAYELDNIFGGSEIMSLDYHYPILNYDNLEIEYTDVSVVGNKFRITSNFILSGTTDSPYKSEFNGHTSDSDTDSGVEDVVELYDYVEDPTYMVMDYLNTSIALYYEDVSGQEIVLGGSSVVFQPKGAIIDGWQRISGDFTIPSDAAYMKIILKNEGTGLNAYFDDVRMHPFDSNLKSFVYDPITQRLQAELDENNYATFYEYDTEGGLVRVKKETERGVYTIQETRSGNSKLNNGSE